MNPTQTQPKMNALKMVNRPVAVSWPKLLAMIGCFCFMALQVSAQEVQRVKVKNANGELVEAPAPPTYTFNGQTVEMSPEKLAWLEGRIAELGQDPATVLTGTVELTKYMDGTATIEPVSSPENQITQGEDPANPSPIKQAE